MDWVTTAPTPVFWLLSLLYVVGVTLVAFGVVVGAYRGLRWLHRRYRWWRFTRHLADAPIPPKGARIIRANGRRVPIDLVYVGEQGGSHVWAPAQTIAVGPHDRFELDNLPPGTAVTIPADLGKP